MTGPSTWTGSIDQSIPETQTPHLPPHAVTMRPVGFVFGYQSVLEGPILALRPAYCWVSEWYPSWATRMFCTMFVASETWEEVTSRRYPTMASAARMPT